MAGHSPQIQRLFGFIGWLLTRRRPVHITDIIEATGYSRANVYRLLGYAQDHFPIEVDQEGLVSVRRRLPVLPRKEHA